MQSPLTLSPPGENRFDQERFRHVAYATSDTIWDWDMTTDVIWWSEGLETVFGYAAADRTTTSAPESRRIHPDDMQRVVDKIYARIDSSDTGWIAEYRFRRNDNSYAHVTDRGYILRDETGKAVRMLGGITDITALKQTELMLWQMNRALRMLSVCNQVMIRASTEQELLDNICRTAHEIGGYQLAWVGYAINDPIRSIVPMAQAGMAERTLTDLGVSWSADLPQGRGPSGMTLRSGEATIIEDVSLARHYVDWVEFAQRFGFLSAISLPLQNGKKTFGVLTLYSSEVRRVIDEERALLRDLANNLAFGIETRRVQEEQRRLQLTVEKVAAAVSAIFPSSIDDFYEQMARHMAEAVGAEAGFITRFDEHDTATAHTMAAVINDVAQKNFSYQVAGTPCEHLLANDECVIDTGLTARFPGSVSLATDRMQAYMGRRLDNAQGKPVGLIFVLFRDPQERIEHTLSTLRIFGARISAELERQLSDLRFRDQAALLDHATDAIVVRDMLGAVTFWNKGAERMYGWTFDEAFGQPLLTRTAAETIDLHETLEHTIREGLWRGELLQRCKDGVAIPVEARWTLILDDSGKAISILAIETNITQRKSDEDEIEHLAFYDRLTDLPNRLLLRDRMQRTIDANRRSGQMSALLYIDMDNFKALNDSLGHHMGDLLLQQAAIRLSHCLRASETVARLGGDQFVILLVDLSDDDRTAASRAKSVAEKILASFETPFELGGDQAHITPSIGITLFSDASDSVDELLRRADLAMCQAKAAGRNTLQFFDPLMQAAVTARIKLEADIATGLEQNQFILHYQPQVDAFGMPSGGEALVRWLHPERGMVPPSEFIPAAEETGLIIPLGNWVLETACSLLAGWIYDPALTDLTMAVNVSARQFRQPDFVDTVLAILQRTGANPRRLKLELTESLLIDSVDDTIRKMTQLKSRGVGFSLDDFGIGYSSLSYLKRLPLDQLKIDQSFVRDILTDPNDEAIARTIVALGNSLGLAVIAEGVETAEQKSRLAGLGCFFYQGYHFSRPVTADAFIAFARNTLPSSGHVFV